jgi:small-conductance mechanosensitive channel
MALLFVLTSSVEPTPVNRTHYEHVLDTEQTIRGPIGTLLNDILLRVQQHDQEQRLDAIQQVQQRQMVQEQLQKQVDGQRDNVEQLKHLQMNFTGEVEHLVEELHETQRNLTLELRHQQVQPSLSISGAGASHSCHSLLGSNMPFNQILYKLFNGLLLKRGHPKLDVCFDLRE